MTAHVKLLVRAICLAVFAAGCGGGGGSGPTAPTTPKSPTTPPTTAKLVLDFSYINVIDDCDGIEGDGDFRFAVTVTTATKVDDVYREVVNLGPGGRTRVLGRRSYNVEAVEGQSVKVTFVASELDKSIDGTQYNDERLSNAKREFSYVYQDAWYTVGGHHLSLGSPGCAVGLNWTAEGG